MGSVTRTVSGMANLVSPVSIYRQGADEEFRTIPAFGRMTINFLPEPAAVLLHGAALAMVLVLGVRRLRS
jgi:hypothetical protein